MLAHITLQMTCVHKAENATCLEGRKISLMLLLLKTQTLAGLNVGVAYTLERSNSGRTASAKAAFESTVRREFNKLMAEGGCSPNEAAAQAIRRAAAVHPSAA